MTPHLDKAAMRDVLIDSLFDRMRHDNKIIFLSADFGAPSLDKMRDTYPDRCISVGIAEQNLIGVAAGFALEGFKVFAYGIAPFLAMRDFEQIRIQLSLLSQTRPINVSLISVGAGISYDVSGPTHHCIEDISLFRTLPNVMLFSPSDWTLVTQFLDFALETPGVKYLRLDGKALPSLHSNTKTVSFSKGFEELRLGQDVCFVTTGYATHMAEAISNTLSEQKITPGLVDVFILKPCDEHALSCLLNKYRHIVTIEEAFIGKGGLDSLILNIVNRYALPVSVSTWGCKDTYYFDNGGRNHLHGLYGMDPAVIAAEVTRLTKSSAMAGVISNE